MKIEKKWCMPSKNTFTIKPIKELISFYLKNKSGLWIDPFCNNSIFKKDVVSNDLNPDFPADYNIEALDFLSMFDDKSVDGVLFDPPYSPRQLKECYNNVGLSLTQEQTQTRYWSLLKKEISRITAPSSICISFGWNSSGVGKNNGFQQIHILLISHGSMHNDTICTVEMKEAK